MTGEDGGAIEITGHSRLQVFTRLPSSTTALRGPGRGRSTVARNGRRRGREPLRGRRSHGSVFGSSTGSRPTATRRDDGGARARSSTAGHGTTSSSYHDNLFYNNVASQNGGAFDFAILPTGGSTNALAFTTTQVIGNIAPADPGAAAIRRRSPGPCMCSTTRSTRATRSSRRSGRPTGVDHFGGGLYVKPARHPEPCGTTSSARQRGQGRSRTGENYGGGGLAASAAARS